MEENYTVLKILCCRLALYAAVEPSKMCNT